ncbi:MAG: HNH endonuclease [Burkholderiales bacterium]
MIRSEGPEDTHATPFWRNQDGESREGIMALTLECECGCGLSPRKRTSRFCWGHWAKTSEGRACLSDVHFQGARSNHGDGYVTVRKAVGGVHQLEHIAIAEKAYGKPLPAGVHVHHVDENRSNNAPSNLVICSAEFHRLLHVRAKAYYACGQAEWRKCSFCGRYDDPSNLYIPPGKGTIEHRACGREYRRKRTEEIHAHA